MEYKDIKEFTRCDRRGEVYAETSGDYALPDYNGDVRRILFTDAKIHSSGSFENGDAVDFSGIVSYTVVYSDSENRINTVSFSSDYDFTVKCNSEAYESAISDLSLASYSVRLLGPRKISARATVSADVGINENVNISPIGSSFEQSKAPEVSVKKINVFSNLVAGHTEREYAEELCRIDGAIADELSVVYADAECYVETSGIEEKDAFVRGNMRIFALLKNGEEPIYAVEKNLKIDESIPLDSFKEYGSVLPKISIGSVKGVVNADEGGCSVVVNVIAEFCAELIGNDEVDAVKDAYCCNLETKNVYEDFNYTELAAGLNEKDAFEAKVLRSELEIEGLREILCIRATPRLDKIEYDDECLKLCGELNFAGIASFNSGDGKLNYHPFKTTVPFEKNVNHSCQNLNKPKAFATVECRMANATLDEENVYLSAALQLRACITEQKTETLLCRSEIVEESEVCNVGSRITVYYPEDGEDIFEIAKKFHTTVEKITEDNSAAVRAMSGASGDFVKKLIIY